MSGANGECPKVFLHLGASKTGTTYLQQVLWQNRDMLRGAGMLYPGLSPDAHFRAATDLCGTNFQEHVDPLVSGAWPRLVDQARSWGGSVVLSHELFSMADGQVAQRALRDLSFAQVHLVCTVRDLARQIPATWQEDVKNRQVLSFGEFAAALRGLGPGAAPGSEFLANLFWRLQDTPGVLRTWAGEIPTEWVHVVTVPPRGAAPELLWQRFAEAVGVRPELADIELEQGSNSSMGIAETNLLRRLNMELGDNLDWPSYDVLVKDHLSLYVLGKRRGRVLRLPAREYGWVAERAAGMVGELRTAGYRVHGDLNELLPEPPAALDAVQPAAGRGVGVANARDVEQELATDPDLASDAEMLDVAVHAMIGLLQWAKDNRRPDEPGWRRTAIRLSQRSESIRRLHHRYLATKARLVARRRGRG